MLTMKYGCVRWTFSEVEMCVGHAYHEVQICEMDFQGRRDV